MPEPRVVAALLLLVAPLFFSSNLIIGRAAADTVEPAALAFWRWFLAFLILLPFTAFALRRHWPDIIALGWRLWFAGCLGMVICGVGIYVALDHTTATNGTLIYTTSPVIIVALEALFRGVQPTKRQLFGMLLAFTGVAIIVLRGDVNRLIEFRFNIGDLGIALGAIAWAIYSVLLRRDEFARLPTLVSFAAIAGAGAILLAPMMVAEAVTAQRIPDTTEAWGSIIGVALISSVLAFSCFQYGIKILGPSVASAFMYLLPVYGVGLAVVFLNEQIETYHWAGFACVAAGLVLSTFRAGKPARRLQPVR
ncbi:MAG: DMT family transporter [Pseudomonadota bacterium]